METIIVKPRLKKNLRFFKEFSKGWAARHDPETLEGKIVRLHREKHYTDGDLEWFLGIPEEYRADPFDTVADGDIYWADIRNVDQLYKDAAQAKRDKAAGRTLTFDSVEELDRHIRSL